MPQDYNSTLNLPSTDFPMRASLPKKEPETLAAWQQDDIYKQMVDRNGGKPLYILHDGPPYANGDIHLGTALNKVLKDIIVRHKNMTGFQAPFIPGWDTHGLPIELKARKKAGVGSDITPVELRKICKEFALHYVDIQRAQFQRLGVLADWDNPYLTLRPEFEARQIKIFGEMAKKGYIYKGLKPVYWCPECCTALAEAEIEYAEDPCNSIYVKFPVKDDNGKLAALGADLAKTYFVIWTTTTWTLPGNLAICVGPDFEYCVVTANGECYVMARDLVDSTMKAAGIAEYAVSDSIMGSELEHMSYTHPFMGRVSPIIVGDHVTLESGTGCVHTAPGFGVEDFDVCKNYPEIKVVVPVDNKGKMTADAGRYAGLTTAQANKVIGEDLVASGNMLAVEKIIHQYPHCWRCKEPVLFRATEQWFCSVADFREDAIKAIKEVNWIPGWGEDRIESMVVDRSDWCISRQRTWGVPIPIFYCDKCGAYHIDDASIQAISELFRREGSDGWYLHEAEEILPKGTKCAKCGGTSFHKEKDIMDVWFDSGSSYASVLTPENGLTWPCDLYIEGADQYRGWFQSSLLTAVATTGHAPYKNCCSCGWVVDGEGRKMSKSLANGTAPEKITEEYGADILRLWVASSDYHSDVRISFEYLKQLSEGYRKIRNTARYILGNISDFHPDTDSVPFEKMLEIDRWAVSITNDLVAEVRAAYEALDFHVVYHAIHNYCSADMSSFYLDVLKDRLYTEKADGLARRSAQTAIYQALRALTLLLAPILSFTAEEIWQYIPKDSAYNNKSVVLNDMPAVTVGLVDAAFMAKWSTLHAVRDDVNKALELARAAKTIGKSLEATVTLYCSGDTYRCVKAMEADLPMLFIVSQVTLCDNGTGEIPGETEGVSVTVRVASGKKCERCWMFSETVGKNAVHPTLCSRCAEVLS
ncbi:MAG: isoleucine--tRNA ligase [Angelakisella sp.]